MRFPSEKSDISGVFDGFWLAVVRVLGAVVPGRDGAGTCNRGRLCFWVFESDKSDITGFLRVSDGGWERGTIARSHEINRDGATSRRHPGGDE